MKIRPVGAELFRADGQTDMTKLIVAFRNFANVPKKLDLWFSVVTAGKSQVSALNSATAAFTSFTVNCSIIGRSDSVV